ncbi:ABC transporter substrate-binding protein [Microbacterium amylolyticum]|uniref:Osmoprotectant transport system substrate-binding protein n=1 Tax=Microbacterium amylolyticum TaxID=936337 RepID=A0ABS4ZJN5_9MICO|nr:ABC transporter substrate-binding protein [Microbacterium amylolyticum]MBP2437503.1 osmoprotectant transport system substrate-binding protein [Microbacterium amylolyticum]
MSRTRVALVVFSAAALTLAGCSSSDPLAGGNNADGTIVVGSQAYYSNEIIAEIYAQALEADGHEVERQFNIGQRDAYMPLLEEGAISLFPEYTGNLLQFFDNETEARSPADVEAALVEALPESLVALDAAEASDQDSYTVTRAFADEGGLSSIADLARLSGSLTLGGPPELSERPYGPTGLADVYGVDVDFSATGDTTVEDLVAGTVDVANVFTADPRIQLENLVVLDDPEALFLASNVVPVASATLADEIAETINAVSAALSADDLVALNVQSTQEEMSTPDIAAQWLAANQLD